MDSIINDMAYPTGYAVSRPLAARSFVQTQLAPFSGDEVEDVGSLMKQMRDHLNSSEFDQDISQILQEIKLAGVSG